MNWIKNILMTFGIAPVIVPYVAVLLLIVTAAIAVVTVGGLAKCAYTNHEINKTADKIDKKDAQLGNANLNLSVANQQTANAQIQTANANLDSKRAEEILANSRANRGKGVTGAELDRMANDYK